MYQDDQNEFSRRPDDSEHQIREPQIRRPDLEDRNAEDTEENIQAEREAFFQDFNNNARQQVHSTDQYGDNSSYAPYSDGAHGVGHYGDDDYYGDGYYDDGYTEGGYADNRYSEDGYSEDGYSENRYSDDGYSDDRHSDDGYAGNRYGNQYQDPRQNQNRDYSEEGYEDGGYVDGGYVDGGYGDERYDGYRESGYDDYQDGSGAYRPEDQGGYGRDHHYGQPQGDYPSRPRRAGYPGQEGRRAPLVSRPDHDDELPPWRRVESEAPVQREPNPALEKLKEVSLESLKGFVLWVRDFISSDPRKAVERAILGQEAWAIIPVLLLLTLILPLYSLILFQHSVAGLNAQISAIQGLAPLLTGGRVYGMNILRYLLEFGVFSLLYWGTLHLLHRPRKLTEAMSAVAVSYFPLLTLLPLMIIFSFFLPTVGQALYAAGMMLQIIFLYHGVKFPLLEGESLAKMIELDEARDENQAAAPVERAEGEEGASSDSSSDDEPEDQATAREPGEVTRKLKLDLKNGEATLPATWVWTFMAFTLVAEVLSHLIATIVVPGAGLF